MDYEFKKIEALIRQAISSSTKWNGSFEKQFAQTRKAVAEERERIKKDFALHAFSLDNEQSIRRYVQYHQYSLISFIDEMFVRSGSKEKRNSKKESSLSIEIFFLYNQMDDILDFIQNHFPKYFDLDAKLPESRKAKLCTDIKGTYTTIHNLLTNQKIDQPLLSICLNPIHKIASNLEPELTYRKILYVETLVHELQKITEDDSPSSVDNGIRSILFYLNYNGEDYFRYYVHFIEADLSLIESETERLEKLAFHLKAISQSTSKPGLIYDATLLPIKEQLSNWLLDEIQYLERKRLLSNLRPFEEALVSKEFKLEFNMSVSQFAYLIKAFIETGVIQNKNISELTRFMAKFIKTKRSENISDDSFRSKYYNVESSTKGAVRNLLHTAIGYINSN